MKRLRKKIHHFTKRELAAEEIFIIILVCFVMAMGSYAASVLLPVQTEIVQCGAREDLPETCRKDVRCCELLNQSGSGEVIIQDPDYPGDIWDDEAAISGDSEGDIHISPDTDEHIVIE